MRVQLLGIISFGPGLGMFRKRDNVSLVDFSTGNKSFVMIIFDHIPCFPATFNLVQPVSCPVYTLDFYGVLCFLHISKHPCPIIHIAGCYSPQHSTTNLCHGLC